MSIFRLAFELFILYLLYKLVFELIIPVVKTTKQVKKQFGEMHDKMNQQQENPSYRTKDTAAQPKTKNEDYIDFEEVK